MKRARAVLVRRLLEPSTWAGLAVLLSMFGLHEPEAKAAADLCALIAAGAAAVLPENKA